MADLIIHQPGPCSTIQDAGRPGWQALGVPEGGALDMEALQIGNALLGNLPSHPAIEICQGGFAAEIKGGACDILLAGSPSACIEIIPARGKTRQCPAHHPARIQSGDKIRIAPFADSLSVLLCLSAHLDLALLYGSASTSPNAGIGGLEGRLLRAGDQLQIKPAGRRKTFATPEIGDFFKPVDQLHIIYGPQDDWFTLAARAALADTPYQVTSQISRMGMRLCGAALDHTGPADIISDGIVRGHIQVPRDGQPIILLADHGTTGGYAKIATVISADLPKLGRLCPGRQIRFIPVTLTEARNLARGRAAELAAILAAILAATPAG